MWRLIKDILYTVYVEPIKEKHYFVAALVILLTTCLLITGVLCGLIIQELIQAP